MLAPETRKLHAFLMNAVCVLSLSACDPGDEPALPPPDTATSASAGPDAGLSSSSEGSTDADGSADPGSIGVVSDAGAVSPPTFALPPGTILVPAYKQPKGDAEKGYRYLITGQYQRHGHLLEAFKRAQPSSIVTLPERTDAKNAGLSYMFTAVQDDKGQDLAALNCLSCHATELEGELIVGLGHPRHNARLDEFDVPGILLISPLNLGPSLNLLGTLFLGTRDGVMDIFPWLASHRDPQTLAWRRDKQFFDPDAGVLGWVDIPPLWRTGKKNALYSNGSGAGVQAHHMSFMSIFSVVDREEAREIEENFIDVGEYLRSMKAPAFPQAIDHELASRGEQTFNTTCAACHGTYGEDWTYPNAIIPYQEVGTESSQATDHWTKPARDWYNESWYARADAAGGVSWFENVEGYYAPPLDGIWATAPFFHNGSVPTLEGVIDPDKRPAVWTSAMRPGTFDFEAVGWKDMPSERVFTLDNSWGVFDTSRPGYSNQGHIYGAHLSQDEKRAVLEYLKSL